MKRRSAVYTGTVRHRRFEPVANEFTYDTALFCLDLSEIPALFRFPGLFSYNKPGLFAFHRKNYLGDPAKPLDECVRDVVQERTGRRPDGPIRILTQISYFGFCFNPATFYYCYDSTGDRVDFIVTEITNTPWNERHAYVLERREEGKTIHFVFPKEFHVSPFMSMDMSYRWLFSAPEEKLLVHMDNFDPGATRRFFDATLNLKRREFTFAQVLFVLCLYPLMTVKTVFLIYYQAAKLWYKNVPFHTHPAKGEPAR